MTAMELLEVMGSIRDPYIREAHEKKKGVSKSRVILIAAIVALMLLLVGCVAVILGMQDLKIMEKQDPVHPDMKDFISLQGYAGSPGYMAQKEWLDFLDSYDQDQNLMNLSPYDSYVPPEEYKLYNCYTAEMVEKLDQLCEKYSLAPITRLYLNWETEEMFKAVGIHGLLREGAAADNYLYGGYFTGDGSLSLSGCLTLNSADASWTYPVEYQYLCAQKGIFHDGFYIGVGNIESYDQWRYTAENSVELLLALNDEKGLILADMDGCFVTVNILSTRAGDVSLGEQQMSRQALEQIAEQFDFLQTPRPVDVQEADRISERLEMEHQLRIEAGERAMRRESYVQYLTEFRNDPQGSYFLLDFDGNGTEELCYAYRENFSELYTMSGGYVKAFETYAFYNGYKIYQTDEGGYVLGSTRLAGQQSYFLFLDVDGNCLRFRDYLKLDPSANGENPWFRCTNSRGLEYMDFMDRPMYWEQLTQEEYESIWNSYTPYVADTRPVSQLMLSSSDLYEQYREEYPGEGLWFFQEDYDGDGLLDLAVFYQGAFRALHRLDEQGREIWQWKPREGFWFYETGYQNFQQTAYECYLPGYSFEEGNLQYHVFLRIESDGLKIRDCLRFDAAKGEWSRADTGVLGVPFAMPVAEQISNWEPVSGEEYGKLLAAYQEMVYELA